MQNQLKVLENQRITLYFKAMKVFPNSPKQLKIRQEIESISNEIKKIQKKLEKSL